jgi:UDP-glucose 4-epimerase
MMENIGDAFEVFRNKKVIITGGLGFIGSNLAIKLLELGAKVTLIDSLIPEYGGSLFNIKGIEENLRVNISDVRDSHSMQYLIRGQDYLFNLAGQTSHIDSMRNPKTDLEINCTSQLSILEACRNQNPNIKVIFASTRQLYGKPDYLPVDENHPLRPVDINGINKMAGEWYHILYNNVYNIRTCALRLTNTYGPRMRIKDARQTFVGIWIRLILQDKPFEVWGGNQLRDFTYISDCVDAFLLAASKEETDGQIYNLGGEEVVSLKSLADQLVEVNGGGSYTMLDFPAERKRIDIGDYYSDFKKFEKAVSWKPRIRLRDGLRMTLDYFKNHIAEYI